MRKLYLFTTAVILSGAVEICSAQSVAGNTFPSANTVNTLMLADTSGVLPGDAGTGVTWDFSGLTNNGQFQVDSFLVPSATPYESVYPTSTIVEHETYPGTDYYIFFKDDGSEFQRVGNIQTGPNADNDTVVYYDPANQYPYPVSFGSNNSDTYFAHYYSNGSLVHMRGTVTNTTDGYGTLQLPTGTYTNVLRVKSVREEADTIISVITVTGHLSQTYYNWYQSSLYYPILTIVTTHTSFGSGQTINSKLVGYREGTSGIENLNNSFQFAAIYPNPSNDYLNVKLNNNRDNATINLYDISGVLVKSQATSDSFIRMNIRNLPTGAYVVKVQTKKGVFSKRWFKIQ